MIPYDEKIYNGGHLKKMFSRLEISLEFRPDVM